MAGAFIVWATLPRKRRRTLMPTLDLAWFEELSAEKRRADTTDAPVRGRSALRDDGRFSRFVAARRYIDPHRSAETLTKT
jgi:hypothetical protein